MLNKDSNNGFKLNIVFLVLFAFSITMTIGVLWEILEFACDSMFGLNMQRAYVSTMSGRGAALSGTEALADTMKDLILDAIGAAVVCIACAISVTKKKIKIEDLTFIRKRTVPANAKVSVNKSKESVTNRSKSEEF